MDRKQILAYVDDALKGLKDFQMASVDALYEGFYKKDRRCMLLADEVGLGKTVVAKGIIAKALKQGIERGKRKPFKVTYICSNQVIARENLRKLNLFPSNVAVKQSVERITYLAYAPNQDHKTHQGRLELNTLTPATSFRISNSCGNKWERLVIYRVLLGQLKMKNRQSGLRWILTSNCKWQNYHELLNSKPHAPIRQGLTDKYVKALKAFTVKIDAHSPLSLDFPRRESISLYDATIKIAERIDDRNWETEKRWNTSHRLIRHLRECLVDCCLPYVDADLYILDEFQRFRDLIDEENDNEEAQIARKIFHRKKHTRILLLSATPFKAFTSYHDSMEGEDHYKDFTRVLRFLLRNDKSKLDQYELHRKELYKQILELSEAGSHEVSSHHRDEVQKILRSVICRTERHSVSANPDALIEDTWKSPDDQIPFGPGDIENFRITDQLARALGRTGVATGKPIEYCKSALYPLSFLDRYKFKELLKANRSVAEVKKALTQSRAAWLDLDKIDQYQWSIHSDTQPNSVANARLRGLVDKAVGPHGAELLWVPPSLPYYKLKGPAKEAPHFSKTLIFSSWIMVPRMISTLISYEVEKRTVGNIKTVRKVQEKEARRYFTAEKKKRHPLPQIVFSRRKTKTGTQLANMSNFTLLYPSLTLCNAVEPANHTTEQPSLNNLIKKTTDQFKVLIEDANLEQYVSPKGEGDRWYWAAPLLLDLIDSNYKPIAAEWIDQGEHWGRRKNWFLNSRNSDKENEEPGAKDEHFDALREHFKQPKQIGLGLIPKDLPNVLARMALGSPAVLAMRSLRRLFPEEKTTFQMVRSLDIAHEFFSLFNKPESIAAVRLSTRHKWYWRRVIDYAAQGCLQAVLDEYFHLLKGQNINVEDVVNQILTAVNLNASTVNVDSLDSFISGESKKMRTHYAVEFGSQKIETSEGQQRASSIRELFNSPFRPFVLATTSIGQEGLDFHNYCRRIVHWNLPGNPVDLEQREGRINRYKSLVIRQQLANKYREKLTKQSISSNSDLWSELFKIADTEERLAHGKCELVPYWHIESDDGIRIERVIPLYPFSIDRSRLDHILKTLAIYRLAFGQPRQTELVDHLIKRDFDQDELQEILSSLVINLSPISY
jgi:hypothetical protein